MIGDLDPVQLTEIDSYFQQIVGCVLALAGICSLTAGSAPHMHFSVLLIVTGDVAVAYGILLWALARLSHP